MCLIGIAISFDEPSCDMAHGAVSAALCDFFRTGIKCCEGIICIHEINHVCTALIYLNLRTVRSKKKSCFSQSILIKKRIVLPDLNLQICISLAVRHLRDRKIDMKSRSCTLPVLLFHMVTTVAGVKRDIWKCHRNIKRIHPVIRIIRMIVVAVLRKHICVLKIIVTAVVVLELSTNMVMLNGICKRCLVRNTDFVGINTILVIARCVCGI